jgi:hypothetical protein
VVFSKEERRIVAVGGIFIEELIDRSQELLRMIGGNRARAAEVCLQICLTTLGWVFIWE